MKYKLFETASQTNNYLKYFENRIAKKIKDESDVEFLQEDLEELYKWQEENMEEIKL